MASRSTGSRFTAGRQSSLAPGRDGDSSDFSAPGEIPSEIDSSFRLMYFASEGDVEGIEELLESGVDVRFKDIDGRTALHVAACQGRPDVVELLLKKGAEVNARDRWRSTPLLDAIYYKNHDVMKLLEIYGAKLQVAPMHVNNACEIPEYEINPMEIDFTNSVEITKGTFRMATWRGIHVAVKTLGEDVITDEDKVRAFRDELALLQQIRHPNVVQFLGAVTQSSPMMIVTEYLPKGDLSAFLNRKGALKPSTAVRFALDIARGMNYLHEHRPEAIIHRELEPSNILLDDCGNMKVADFGVSKLLKVANTVREDDPLPCQGTACRYMAPEVFRKEEYGTKADVFSFSLILQEMIEPFAGMQDNEVPKAYLSKKRPSFTASPKLYAHGLRELIEQCWSENPADRPTFREIIDCLSLIQYKLAHYMIFKLRRLMCISNPETFWKGYFDSSSRSSRSSKSSRSIF